MTITNNKWNRFFQIIAVVLVATAIMSCDSLVGSDEESVNEEETGSDEEPDSPAPSYTISYDTNGATTGSLDVTSFEFPSGTRVDLLEDAKLRLNGRPFKGWSTTKDGDVIQEYTLEGDTVLYAQFFESYTEAYLNGELIATTTGNQGYYYYVGDPGTMSVRTNGLRVDFHPADTDTIDTVYVNSYWADPGSRWTFTYFYSPPNLREPITNATITIHEYDYLGQITFDFDMTVSGTGLTEGEEMRIKGRVDLLSDL